jgi:hypothetical protein
MIMNIEMVRILNVAFVAYLKVLSQRQKVAVWFNVIAEKGERVDPPPDYKPTALALRQPAFSKI